MKIENKIFTSYVIVGITIFLMLFYPSVGTMYKEERIMYCGVIDDFSGNERGREGRKLFKSLCASCHKLNKKLVGPPLGNVKKDSVDYYKFMNSKNHKPRFPMLTQKNINDIILYTKN